MLVGYDTDENSLEHFLVKNSWGEKTGWSKDGYFKVEATEGKGTIGMNTDVWSVEVV